MFLSCWLAARLSVCAISAQVLRAFDASILKPFAPPRLLRHRIGSGERLNEHVVGAGWPGLLERHERFAEAVDIIQGLLSGRLSNYRGKHLQLDHARLFDRPTTKPAVVIAAGGPKAARFAGEKGDGLMATEARSDLVQEFRKGGSQLRAPLRRLPMVGAKCWSTSSSCTPQIQWRGQAAH
jgi:Luciferase-like monooxygenase